MAKRIFKSRIGKPTRNEKCLSTYSVFQFYVTLFYMEHLNSVGLTSKFLGRTLHHSKVLENEY